ncbi:MAG TPA: prepilin-type N-terminal cleavage/methylation domain-containing protein [Tepidisphaeraceae bacterium]|nr:prepilin-type N-terminal cleavage/methylation domain-containing protein [Tepidisphaeraceae bacterium]
MADGVSQRIWFDQVIHLFDIKLVRTVSTISHRPHPGRQGFTLVEAALATVIIGVGVLATMQLFGACTRNNASSAQMTTALLLAQNVQEVMADLPFNDPVWGNAVFGAESGETLQTYDDIDDFDSQTLQPPIDATRTPLSQLSQYSQVISVVPVYPNKLSVNTNATMPDIPKRTYTGAVRVCVRVLYQQTPGDVAEEVYRLSWIRLEK